MDFVPIIRATAVDYGVGSNRGIRYFCGILDSGRTEVGWVTVENNVLRPPLLPIGVNY